MNFSQISILLVVASLFGIFAKYIKLPILVGFLFAGIFISRYGFFENREVIDLLGKIGITLLLFLVGLEMNIEEMSSSVGKTAIITGLGQIIFTTFFGFILASFFGFALLPSFYIGISLAFSSTVIVVKLLSEKKDLNSLYGKISLGFLLVQDIVAIFILMILSAMGNGHPNPLFFIGFFVKSIFLFICVWYLSQKVTSRLFEKFVGKSPELLFLVSISWALGISSVIGGPLGLSFEIGGFLAGLTLSTLPEHLGISAKTKPLRDFFLTIFFVSLGSGFISEAVGGIMLPALIFSLFILVATPLIIMSLMSLMGYKKRTSFFVSIAVSQVSEFSFVLMTLGHSLGHIGQKEVSILTLVGIVTMITSTYLISNVEKLHSKISKFLTVFEKKNSREKTLVSDTQEMKNHIIIVGCGRTGRSLLSYFKKREKDVLVVDHNPKVFEQLTAEKIRVILGDITDPEILDAACINSAKAVICTISSFFENANILERIKSLDQKPLFIGGVQDKTEALNLYSRGADYVIVPEIIAGEFLRHIFIAHGLSNIKIKKMGKLHFNRLIYAKS